MLVNACFWAANLEDKIRADNNVAFVGPYQPSTFRMNANYYVGVQPDELAGWDTPIMPNKPLKSKSLQPNRKAAQTVRSPARVDHAKTRQTSSRRQQRRADHNRQQTALELEPGDHVCLVGNGLGEDLQHENQWETLLHQSLPDKQLTVRNLCFPGDTVGLRLRSLNFGEPDVHLRHSAADVVLYFFGSNESFAGEGGREAFSESLDELVRQTKQQDYSGRGRGTKVVLVSPIAFEMTGDPNLPDGKQENARLKSYTDTIRRIAVKNDVGFVDLFTPTYTLFGEARVD
jgi:lysophospholipase L1-like esterase